MFSVSTLVVCFDELSFHPHNLKVPGCLMKPKFMKKDNASRITFMVRRIPLGNVATYGQVATLAGLPQHARQVGAVLRSLPDGSDVPWHRVVNSQGRISLRHDDVFERLQRHELQNEGIVFDDTGKLDLSVYQWRP